jgi:hypothetical protein
MYSQMAHADEVASSVFHHDADPIVLRINLNVSCGNRQDEQSDHLRVDPIARYDVEPINPKSGFEDIGCSFGNDSFHLQHRNAVGQLAGMMYHP